MVSNQKNKTLPAPKINISMCVNSSSGVDILLNIYKKLNLTYLKLIQKSQHQYFTDLFFEPLVRQK